MIVDAEISKLAGRVPLVQPEDPNGSPPSEDADMSSRRWPPLWAGIFVCAIGLVSWGAIAAVIVRVIE